MSNKQKGEVTLAIGSDRYTLVFDWEAIAIFEDATDRSILEVMGEFDAAARGAGGPPKLTTLASLLSAAMQRHHPAMDRSACMGLVISPEAQSALAEAFEFAMPIAEDPGEVGNGPAGKPAARKSPRSTGKAASAKRSKPGSRSKNSGARRRA